MGCPAGVEGRFSTARESQCEQRPRAANSIASTSSAVTFCSGTPDINRGALAFLAFWAHHRRRSAAVVCRRNSSHELYLGAGRQRLRGSGSGAGGAGSRCRWSFDASVGGRPEDRFELRQSRSLSLELGQPRPFGMRGVHVLNDVRARFRASTSSHRPGATCA